MTVGALRARVLEDETAPASVPLTDAEWARALADGRRVRWLVKAEQIEWAGKRAVSCGSCANTKLHGDPRRGWCTVHRMLVSLAFTVLCREYAA